MNIFQSLNVGVFGLTIAALFGGVNRYPGSIEGLPHSLWLFVSFVFFLRLKMCLDDHKYFGFAKTKSRTFKTGFLLGAISWMLWGLAAWALPNPQTAYFLAGMAILGLNLVDCRRYGNAGPGIPPTILVDRN